MRDLTSRIVKGMSSRTILGLQERVDRLSPDRIERDKNIIFRNNKYVLSFLKDLTGIEINCIRQYFTDLINDTGFHEQIRDNINRIANNKQIGEFSFFASFLYVIIRAIRPEVVVETGVASGKSSLYILKGLCDNNKGRLFSIDLPPDPQHYQKDGYLIRLPAGSQVGWLVPETLRDRWELILGDALNVIPDLYLRLGTIDFFFHDSLHTYEQMIFEFNYAFKYLRSGGVIWSDNVNVNDAYADFIDSNRLNPLFFRQTGGVKKS